MELAYGNVQLAIDLLRNGVNRKESKNDSCTKLLQQLDEAEEEFLELYQLYQIMNEEDELSPDTIKLKKASLQFQQGMKKAQEERIGVKHFCDGEEEAIKNKKMKIYKLEYSVCFDIEEFIYDRMYGIGMRNRYIIEL